jgi:tetratricopeptide (TPR) repeat protein
MPEDLKPYVTPRPVVFTLLFVAAVVLFLAVSGLSRVYHAQQDSLGQRWSGRGIIDLNAGRFDRAVIDFRTALFYSRDNYTYQLHLAEGLIGLKRTSEAYAYLINLWDREPENGSVNLAIARIAAEDGRTEQALRYYHNAVYATWRGDQEVKRRDTRLELINYLLRINSKAEAQAELMALEANLLETNFLEANLEDGSAQQANLGNLFLQTRDYDHALAAYRQSLKADHHNHAALAGAGVAAFQLGHYPAAQKYLQDAVTADPGDAQSAAELKTTELVVNMDPFRRQLSVAERDRIVLEAFAAAGERLKSCSVSSPSYQSTQAAQALAEAWTTMEPRISVRGLRQNPDLVEKAMDLVFSIERQANVTCGPPSGADMALLLIAKLHD